MNEHSPGDYVLSSRTVHMACTWLCVWSVLLGDKTSHFSAQHTVSWFISEMFCICSGFSCQLSKNTSSNIFKCIPRSPTHTWNIQRLSCIEILTELRACKSVGLTVLWWLPWQQGSCKCCLIIITYGSCSCQLPAGLTSVMPSCFNEQSSWFVCPQ